MRLKFQIATAVMYALMLIISMHYLAKPKLVVVDIKRAVEVAAQTLARSQLSSSAQKDFMQKFGEALPLAIASFASKHQVTVVSAHVLISQNNTDITANIITNAMDEVRHEK